MTIALALSGGGFRATLFHLGVIQSMQRHDLLRNVSAIYAVSGGSIMAGHLFCHWEEYLDPGRRASAADELLEFVQHDVRGRILRRLVSHHALFGWRRHEPARTWLFRDMLDRLLYRRARLITPSKDSVTPRVELLATNLIRGTIASFYPGGFSPDALTDPGVPCEVSLATAVAASAAFPAFFPPVRIDHRVLGVVDYAAFPSEEYLTDGGVFDNLGLRRLSAAAHSGEQTFSTIIVSDAGGAFDWIPPTKASGLMETLLRASDIFMLRIHDLEYEAFAPLRGQAGVHVIRISDELPPADHELGLPAEVQRLVKRIRTDLDDFGPEERRALIAHGASVAAITLNAPPRHRDLTTIEQQRFQRKLARAERRRPLYSFFLSPRDPLSWAHASILLLLVFAGLTYLWTTSTTRRLWREKRLAVEQLRERLRPGAPPPRELQGVDVTKETARFYFDDWSSKPGLSKVSWIKEFDIVKRSAVAQAHFRFATTGSALHAVCENCSEHGLPWSVDVYRSADVSKERQPSFRLVWIVNVDLNKLKQGQAITLRTRVTNWDGFIPDNNGHVMAAISGRHTSRPIDILIHLPSTLPVEERAFHALQRRETTSDVGGTKQQPCATPTCIIALRPQSGMATLSIPTAEPDTGYALQWNMPRERNESMEKP